MESIRIPLGESFSASREARMGHGPQVISYLAVALRAGLLEWILKNPNFTLSEAMQFSKWKSRPHAGICLRMWISCGWLGTSGSFMDADALVLTLEGKKTFERACQLTAGMTAAWEFIQEGSSLKSALLSDQSLPIATSGARFPVEEKLSRVLEFFFRYWDLPKDSPRCQLLDYLDGSVAQIVHLSVLRAGICDSDGTSPIELRTRTSSGLLEPCLQALCTYGYLYENDGGYRSTPLGARARRYYSGWLSMSYLSTFARIESMLMDDLSHLMGRDPETGFETHVDRELNIVGSRINHQNILGLSKAFDRWLPELFAQNSIDTVCDMGCGTGDLLLLIHKSIQRCTERGRHLDLQPIRFIGVDHNEESCRFAAANLLKSGLPSNVMIGDVGDPERLLRDLRVAGVDTQNTLHIRSFLDHDRAFKVPRSEHKVNSEGTAIYVKEDGGHISNTELLANLVEHLAGWKKILGSAGLIAIELHAVDPAEAAKCEGRVPMEIEYVQLLTSQFPVEYEIWISSAIKAGLKVKNSFCFTYGLPSVTYASITHFTI